MTTKQIRIVTILIVLAGAILNYGDKVQQLSWLPGWAVHLWSMVYIAAGIFKETASLLWPQIVATPAQPVTAPLTVNSPVLEK